MIVSHVHHRCRKHIEIYIHFIREKVALGHGVPVLHMSRLLTNLWILWPKTYLCNCSPSLVSAFASVTLPLWLLVGDTLININVSYTCLVIQATSAYIYENHPFPKLCVVFLCLSSVTKIFFFSERIRWLRLNFPATSSQSISICIPWACSLGHLNSALTL